MPLLFDSGPKMRRDDFRLLRDLFRDFCGIQFADEMRLLTRWVCVMRCVCG